MQDPQTSTPLVAPGGIQIDVEVHQAAAAKSALGKQPVEEHKGAEPDPHLGKTGRMVQLGTGDVEGYGQETREESAGTGQAGEDVSTLGFPQSMIHFSPLLHTKETQDVGGKYYANKAKRAELHTYVDHQRAVLEQTGTPIFIRITIFVQQPAEGEDSDSHEDRLVRSGYPRKPVRNAPRDFKAKRYIKKATRRYQRIGLSFPFKLLKGEIPEEPVKDRKKKKKKDYQ